MASTVTALIDFAADVCNGHHDFNSMTTPQEMLDNTLTSLRYLDNGVLPKGSHVFLVGLADGTLLYNYLHNRTHPLGALRYAEHLLE
jgi:acyloxyacyl hydrolase